MSSLQIDNPRKGVSGEVSSAICVAIHETADVALVQDLCFLPKILRDEARLHVVACVWSGNPSRAGCRIGMRHRRRGRPDLLSQLCLVERESFF